MASILSAARASLLLTPVGILISLGAMAALARVLPRATYADYMTWHGIVLTVTLLAEGGISAAFLRYMPAVSAAGAAQTLYYAAMRRRLLLSVVAAAAVMLAGPLWARWAGLDPHVWTYRLFAIAALSVVVTLVQSVPYYGLLGLLRHAEAGVFLHAGTLIKGVAVAVAAYVGAAMTALALIHAVVSLVVAGLLLARMKRLVRGQDGFLTDPVSRDSLRYGLVSTIDKLSSWAGSTAVLLIVLAPWFSREALASLAVAGDVLLKVLAVASMPVSNVITPYLARTLSRGESLRDALGLACRATTLVFVPAIAALLSTTPFLLPLLFGTRYVHAVPLLMIIAVPTAVESWVRFVIVPGLLARQQYRWITLASLGEGVLILAVALLGSILDLVSTLGVIGIVKLLYAVSIGTIAFRRELFPSRIAPRGLVLSSIIAAAIAWAIAASANRSPAVDGFIAATAFAIVLAFTTRTLLCVDAAVHDAIRLAAGRLGVFVKWVPRC